MELNKLIRPNIQALKPYVCARDEFASDGSILLDANENPYPNGCNRYPDPRHRELKSRMAALFGVRPEQMVLGNGSDEVIDLLIRSICRPGVDNIVVYTPSYQMYEVCAAVNDVEVRRLDLTADFLPDAETLLMAADGNTKLAFICSPNNPTGNVVSHSTIADICRSCGWLVVVDEAYIDFSDSSSVTALLDTIPNLFVLRTLSKSWGMAGLRIGAGIGRPELISVLDRVKPPYNISGLSQRQALELLADERTFATRIAEIKNERERLSIGLSRSGIFREVYPSQANFLLATADDYRELYDYLLAHGVILRMRDIPPLIPGGLRISIGTPEENDRLLKLIEQYENEK